MITGTPAERMCYPETIERLVDLGYKYEETLRIYWSDLRDLPTVEIGKGPYFYAKVYGDQYYICFVDDDSKHTGKAICDIFTKEAQS